MTHKAMIEVHSIDYVPHAERHGKVRDLWPVWFSGDANLATLAVGVIGIALGGTMLWTALAVIGGCALGTFFMAFHSTQGPQLGLPQLIQSRPQFGYMGALLVWVVAMIAYIGYNAFNGVLAAQAVRQLAGTHAPADSFAIILVFLAVALAMAVVGYDWIHHLQRIVAYCMLALLARVHGGRTLGDPLAAAAARAGCVQDHTLPGAVLCRGRLSVELVHLCQRLLALPAGQRRRGGVVLRGPTWAPWSAASG